MTLQALFEVVPLYDVEKIFYGLEQTQTDGSLKVQFVRIEQMILDELERHEVISRCERTGSYRRGVNFNLLQEFINNTKETNDNNGTS